jgi:putative ABC transport system ATP-binding protein
MNQPILELRSITKSIDTGTHRVDILRGIDLTIERGEFVAIMGASGSGKSTLLGLLAGLDAPTTGEIRLDGDEISRLAEDSLAGIRGRKIGFVFQSYQLIPTLTAEENVLLPAELAGEATSGALERAFMRKPPLLLADEPTGNLDSTNGRQVLELLLSLNRAEGATLVLVTHDRDLATYATRVITLKDGVVVSDERRQPAA